ncbi:biotin transporter BioY [Chlamydia caviae]|uniref:Biotin transporter n=1 Tax=Chlamydia caviae (strain ATCC VR-813 / DSM 19441 / 03DC25 / GPIC) TaxID=227941 RepID=Q822H6_CHLCV|nr:biotin transporter BioY [Chlamydia caviae]AAP05448.1 conserved hypothetical protein [Chlamydia caviae GPIC]
MSYSLAKRSWLLGVLNSPIVKILEGSIFLTLLAKISFPLPFTPTPITFQTLGVYCIGVAYSPLVAFSSVVAYLLEGLFFPVFYGAEYGVNAFFRPTAGYLYAFPLTAAFISQLYRLYKNPSNCILVSILTGAASIILVFGSIWLAIFCYLLSTTEFLDLVLGLQLGALPFIPGEVVKIALVVQGRMAVQFFQKQYLRYR